MSLAGRDTTKIRLYAHDTACLYCLLHFPWVVDDAKCIVVIRLCVSVCVSVRGRMPTLLHGSGCNFGEWQGLLPSCAMLGGFAIGARVVLLWQHNANPSYKLASISRCDNINQKSTTRTINHWFIWTADKPQPLNTVHNIKRKIVCNCKIVRTRNVSECIGAETGDGTGGHVPQECGWGRSKERPPLYMKHV